MAKKSLISTLISKLPGKGSNTQQNKESEQKPRIETAKLKLVFFIVDWHRANVVSNVCVEEKVRFHFTTIGRGTANDDILDLLGIGATEKAVITCLEQEIGVPVLMKEARKKLKSYGPGAGIAFTISLSAINDPILLIFKQSILKNVNVAQNTGEGAIMKNDHSHDLIICIVNHGNSDELMNTARAAGATGGTVINARGQAHEGAVKFFGISVQDEKEMILILTASDKKEAIMQAVCKAHGLNSEAQGIVFSLPVDNVIGLSLE